MKVQILGSGCEKCKKLAANVKLAAEQHSISCEIEKVQEINKITEFGVMMTPALVVDGKVVNVGKVLSVDEIAKFLTASDCACGADCDVLPKAKTTAESTSSCPVPSLVASCGCREEEESLSCCNSDGVCKKVMTLVLLVFVVASIAFMVLKQIKGEDPVAVAKHVTSSVVQNANAMVVYYFHGNQRCFTCNKIEALTKQSIESKYVKELIDGNVIFASINVEELANEHFVKDFDLATRSVVIQKNGKFEKFDAVWTLVRDSQKFTEYIQNGAQKIMETK